MPREWDSEEREPWNPKIATIVKAIDLHNVYYFKDGDERHKQRVTLFESPQRLKCEHGLILPWVANHYLV